MREMKKLYIVLGEASGDALATEVFKSLSDRLGENIQCVGLAGPKLSALGVESLFDIEDLSVMGLGPVLARLPKLIRRVYQTVADIERQKPDAILLIDSPEFCAAVAKRVRNKNPDLPIIKYVCPSVWAWRPSRAKRLGKYINHVLALLPFEPEVMAKLNGPETTYVGHPLATSMTKFKSRKNNLPNTGEIVRLMILPGSRRGEIENSLPVFCRVLKRLQVHHNIEAVLPTFSALQKRVQEIIDSESLDIRLINDRDEFDQLLKESHIAMATSGTVSLELALAKLPHVVFYKPDWLARRFLFLITTWSVNLPNLIANRVVVPELIGPFAREERLLREMAALLTQKTVCKAQISGFETVWVNAATQSAPAEKAAQIICRICGWE